MRGHPLTSFAYDCGWDTLTLVLWGAKVESPLISPRGVEGKGRKGVV